MTDESSKLTTWATAHGCTFHSIQVLPHPVFGGYGLFNSVSTKAVAVDNERTALFIPNSLIISMDLISEAAEESDELADVLNALPHHPTLEPIITVFLVYQVYLHRENRPSKFSTYLETLPDTTLLPITWSENEVEFLSWSGTSISRAVPAKLAFLKSLYETLQHVQGWFNSISWNEYVLAESWVSSRTIEDPRTGTPLLVPILDMANHSPTRTAAWEVTDEGIELRREPVEIPAGGEITISYDLDRGTGERLYRYGFIEDPNMESMSKGVTLVSPFGTRLPGGNIFRLTADFVGDDFDLSFLSYENW